MSQSSNALFFPLQIGPYEVKNRVVLAPLTRIRSDKDLCPTENHVKYYSQRADNNLLITEATIISQQSIASHHIPACFNQKQAEAWKKVVDSVHAKGGRLSLQAWHQGRAAHASYTNHPLAKEVNAIVSESSCEIALPDMYEEVNHDTLKREPRPQPKMMTIDDIERFKKQLVHAADLALNVAGFDFFELHGAHGYLFDQFFNAGSNTRTDQYGGSLENRLRLLVEVLDILVPKYPGRIAIRISPHRGNDGYHAVSDPNPMELYHYVSKTLSKYDLGYVLWTEPRWNFMYQGLPENDVAYTLPMFSAQFIQSFREVNKKTVMIGCGGFTAQNALETMNLDPATRPYDAIGFGRWYISTPDIVFRIKNYLPFTRYNRSTFYTSPPFETEKFPIGYTDYPTFEEIVYDKLGTDVKLEQVITDQKQIDKLVSLCKDDLYALCPLDVIGKSTSTDEREGKKDDDKKVDVVDAKADKA